MRKEWYKQSLIAQINYWCGPLNTIVFEGSSIGDLESLVNCIESDLEINDEHKFKFARLSELTED